MNAVSLKLRICLLMFLVINVLTSYGTEFPLGAKGVLSLSVPQGWRSAGQPTKKPDGTDKGFVLTFQPTNALSAKCFCSIDFAYIANGAPDKSALQKDLLRLSEGLVPKSVEGKANLKEFSLEQGYGAYCLFTDASLVGKPVPKGEFRVMGVGLIQPGPDILGVVTMTTDDPETKEFQTLLKTINSLKLKASPPRLLLDEKKK